MAIITARSGNNAGDGGDRGEFSLNSSTSTIDARSRRQNSRRALVIVPPDNL